MTSRKSRQSALPHSRTLSFFPDTSSDGIGALKTGLERRGSAPLVGLDGAGVDQPVIYEDPAGKASRSPKKRPGLTKSWSSRLSSMLPSLKSPTDIHRKPLAPHAPNQAPPPPPPYRIHDPPQPTDIPAGIKHAPTAPTLSLVDSSPPEAKRATLTKQAPPPKQAPAPKPSSRRSSLAQDVGYLAEAGYLSDASSSKLRKNSNDAGRRSSVSDQSPRATKGGYPEPLIKASQTMAMDEGRGRSVSAQVPGTARTSTSGTRVISSPAAQPAGASPSGSAGHSPSRGRLRRSWLPGMRSRSNSIDPSGANGSGGKSVAWVMSDGSNAEYNHSFLANGEKVSERMEH